MTEVFADQWLTVHEGDCRQVMGDVMEERSVQAVITSPPYFQLRDYPVPDTIWPLRPTTDCAHDFSGPALRARQKNGQSVGGKLGADKAGAGRAHARDKTSGRWCIKNCMTWKGQLGLEPDPWLYVEHLVEVFDYVGRVLADDGVAWLNLGDSYASVPYVDPEGRDLVKKGDLIGIPWMVALALRRVGWYLRTDIVWDKPNAMPESPSNRPNRVHEYIFLLSKRAQYLYDVEANREPSVTDSWTDGGTRRQRDVWRVPTVAYPDAHFAVFPPNLVAPMVRASTKHFATVLDPFAGSGTVGLVAQSMSRHAVLIDASSEYLVQQLKRGGQTPLGLEVR